MGRKTGTWKNIFQGGHGRIVQKNNLRKLIFFFRKKIASPWAMFFPGEKKNPQTINRNCFYKKILRSESMFVLWKKSSGPTVGFFFHRKKYLSYQSEVFSTKKSPVLSSKFFSIFFQQKKNPQVPKWDFSIEKNSSGPRWSFFYKKNSSGIRVRFSLLKILLSLSEAFSTERKSSGAGSMSVLWKKIHRSQISIEKIP